MLDKLKAHALEVVVFAAVIALAGLLLALGHQKAKTAAAQIRAAQAAAALADCRAQHAEAVARASAAALKHDAALRALETLLNDREREHDRELQATTQENARRLAAARAADDDRVRAAIAAALAPRPGETGEAAAGAQRERAAAAGDVLGEGLRLADELAAAAEGHAAEVRRLLEHARTLTCDPGGG